MKAESVVMTGVQKPLTLFGIPPQMFVFVAAGSGIVFGVFVAIDLLSLALIVAMIVFIFAWLSLFRQTRLDHHFSNFVFSVPRFWRSRPTRWLIAGRERK